MPSVEILLICNGMFGGIPKKIRSLLSVGSVYDYFFPRLRLPLVANSQVRVCTLSEGIHDGTRLDIG